MWTRLLTLVLALTLTAPALAAANPMSMNVLRVKGVPGTRHVQVTLAKSGGGSAGEVKRDGVVITPTWTTMSGYQANMGSGVSNVAADQFCDCLLPIGLHEYQVAATEGGTLNGSIVVTGVAAAPIMPPPNNDDADSGQSDAPADVMPWDEPEPTGLQGLDCAVTCAATPPADTTDDTTVTDGIGAQDTTGGSITPPAESSGSNCSAAPTGRVAGLAGLLALLVVGLFLRRRA
ncbi:MAG: MYXO-CTERM sorting domain-containing protein [Myxococcota bacterium]